MSTTIEDEAQGVSARFDVTVKTGTIINAQRTIALSIPFASSSTQMINSIKTFVRSELLRLDNVNVADQDTFVFGASLTQ